MRPLGCASSSPAPRWGAFCCDIRYQDGRRPLGRVVTDWPEDTIAGEPAHDAPLIDVGMTLRQLPADAHGREVRPWRRSPMVATVGDTRWTLLLLLHGIVQQQRYIDAYRALPVFPAELGWWGEAAPFVPSDLVPR